jgi:hypothetical protein
MDTSTTNKPRTKTKWNEKDERFAFIKWINQDKFNIVGVCDFEESESYELEAFYKIRWPETDERKKFKTYRGQLIFIGSKDECEAREIQATTHLRDTTLTKNITKNLTEKVVKQTTSTIISECQIKQHEEHVKQLENKLKEKNSEIDQLKIENTNLRQKLSESEIVSKNNEKDLQYCSKNNLLAIASCIFNNLGSSNDLEALSVRSSIDDETKMSVISSRHPDIKISYNLKLTLDSMKLNKNQTTSKIYRTLIYGLLPLSASDFASSNFDILVAKYAKLIDASKDYMSNIDFQANSHLKIFTNELCTKTLRELCFML